MADPKDKEHKEEKQGSTLRFPLPPGILGHGFEKCHFPIITMISMN